MSKDILIRHLEAQNKAMVEALPGFIFVFDDLFILREVLLPSNMTLLHSMKELIGMSGRMIYSPEVSELILHNIKDCLKDGLLRELEYPVELNGLRFYYQARIVPYKDNMVLAMIQDIGDRVRRVEELVEARQMVETNQMKSTFLANMSHEIRTPLNAIVGFSQVLAEETDPDSKEEFVSLIRTNSDLLLQLINDILDISRIESGKVDVIMQDININQIMDETYQVHKNKTKPGVELIKIIPEHQIIAYADPNRLKQILNNFLSNAIKHTFKGNITMKLEVDKSGELTFSVTDTGTGIKEDKLPHVFERFEKMDSFTQGTGLGLAISKTLVEHMGGEIKATSVYGKSSTFSFTLPPKKRILANNSYSDANKMLKGKNASLKKEKTILILEPDDTDLDLMESLLSDSYSIIRTNNIDKALYLFTTKKPDLVLINVSDPSGNGLDGIKEIRKKSYKTPLIAIATYGNYKDQELALKAGSNDILLKPYSTSRLKEAIVAYI